MKNYTCTSCQEKVEVEELYAEFAEDEDEVVAVASTGLCLDCFEDATPNGEPHGEYDEYVE